MEVPHVSNRVSVSTLRSHHGNADYLLLNTNAVSSDTRTPLKDAQAHNDDGLVASDAPFYPFKRGLVDSPAGSEGQRSQAEPRKGWCSMSESPRRARRAWEWPWQGEKLRELKPQRLQPSVRGALEEARRRPSFAPTQPRYVRLRALRRTHLHFKDVRIQAPRGVK